MKIELKNLVRDYGTLHAVKNISLTIPENRIFGIIGRSGAGKSTLVRLISLLEKPDSGEIYFDNDRVDQLSKEELIKRRRTIGMIFQNFNLFSSRTAGQNVAYPLEICGVPKAEIASRVKELMEIVGLSDRIDAPISTLSGGQKQRVAIARALANKPQILFCDEATSALDPQTTRAILNLIKEIQKKMNLTVIMITHQMEVVRDSCNYVAVLDAGSVVEEGSVSDIFASPKTAVTKDFLAHLTTISSGRKDVSIAHFSKERGHYVLRFRGETTDSPVLSRLCKKFNVDTNIRSSGVQFVDGEEIGTLTCDFTGDPDDVKSAIEYLRSKNIIVEEALRV